ncbi:MAG: DUF4058 family protein [Pseudomonadota bacterium]
MAQSPFPGMDPYLESPSLWPDVHNSLINIFREQISPLLPPRYVAELETQLVIDDRINDPISAVPDVTITETEWDDDDTAIAIAEAVDTAVVPASLHLKFPKSAPTRITSIYVKRIEGDELVTIIELLSPSNKRHGKDRQKYVQKLFHFYETGVHLVEIDLLRQGARVPLVGLPKTDYLAMVSRVQDRPNCDVWPIGLRKPLPVLPIPLLRPDMDMPLDLGKALRTAYERAHYERRINYNAPATPPLKSKDMTWAAKLLGKDTNQ